MTAHVVRLLLLSTLLIAGAAAIQSFSIVFESKSDCDAKVAVGIKNGCKSTSTCHSNGKYEVSHANIYFVDRNTGKINGIVGCLPGNQKCTSSTGKETGDAYVLLTVTLDHSSSEDQNVHYMYHEKLFGLSRVDPPGSPGNIHSLDNFLFVKSITYGGHKFDGGECSSNRVKSVISGHGYFIAKMGGSNSWENMYYLPQRPGQYIFTPK